MSVLHVFDMDGTLLLGSTASVELARLTGGSEEIDLLEELSAAGKLTNVEFHRRSHPLWQGLTADVIDAAFAEAPWIANLRAVWDDITARGETAVVISMSPLFFVERLSRWGAASVYASHNPIGSPFDETLVLEDFHKVEIVERLVADGGFARGRVVAYGDSYTDLPLFRTGICSVAVNATAAVEELAVRRYRGDDLREAYALARSLID
jgi:phosphoserine phosphatase